jgi:AcrR family transcriptional regulator
VDETEGNSPDTAPRAAAPRRNKRETVLAKAAELIARQGFDGTSMRDIAAAVDMLPGSLYYHFASKDDLLIDIHKRVVDAMLARVEAAIAGATDPWDRLERAAIAHLEGLIETGSLVTIVSPNFPKDREHLNLRLKEHRNGYEALFNALFAALDLAPGVDRRLLRLHLLGALNWVPVWFNPKGRTPPAEIARRVVRAIRHGVDAAG